MSQLDRRRQRVAKATNAVILVIVAMSVISIGLLYWGPLASKDKPEKIDAPQVDRTKLSERVDEQLTQAYEGLEEFPEQASSWGFLGQILFANGFLEEGAKCFEKAIELEPQEPKWSYFLGVYHEPTDSSRAEELYRAAIENSSQSQDIELRLAELLLIENRLEECRTLLQNVREFNTASARLEYLEARLILAEAAGLGEEERRAQLVKAQNLAEEAVQLAPKRPETHALLAQIYFQLGNPAAQTEAELGQAESFGWPDDYLDVMFAFRGDLRYRIYLAEQSNTPVESRLELLREAVREEPEVPGWHGRLANAHLEAGELPKAESTVRNGIKLHPEAAELHYVLGLIRFFAGDFEAAESSFQSATQFKTDYTEAYLNLGMSQRELEKFEEAVNSFQQVVRFDSSNVQGIYNLAFTLNLAGKPEQALNQYKVAIDLAPAILEPYLDAAEIHRKLGNKQQALDFVNRVLQREPENEQAIKLRTLLNAG